MDAFVYSAVFIMRLIEAPLSLTADVLAAQVLLAAYTLVSTPAGASVHFNQREMVSELAGVCGAKSVRNKFELLLFLKCFLRLRYSFSVITTQKDLFSMKLCSSVGA